MSSTAEESIVRKLKQLPPEQQWQVLEFVDSLARERASKPVMGNPFGLWAELEIDITEEDIAQVRQEMWENFPREDV